MTRTRVIDTIFEPEAPGRGPGRMGETYHWDRLDDFPIIGRFAGVVLGVRKGADTLIVAIPDDEDDEFEIYLSIRYEHLVRAVRLKHRD